MRKRNCARCRNIGVIPTSGKEHLAGTPLCEFTKCPECNGDSVWKPDTPRAKAARDLFGAYPDVKADDPLDPLRDATEEEALAFQRDYYQHRYPVQDPTVNTQAALNAFLANRRGQGGG